MIQGIKEARGVQEGARLMNSLQDAFPQLLQPDTQLLRPSDLQFFQDFRTNESVK